MSRKILGLGILIFVIGGIGGVMFNRFVIPWAATLPGFSGLHKLESSHPVVINRTEEIHYNDGANFIDISKQGSAYTVGVYTQSGGTTRFLSNGVIATADGMIVTSKTSIANQTNLIVVTNDGNTFPAQVRALDPRSELAVLTINATNLPFAQFSDADGLQASQRLIYVGRSNKEFVRDFAIGVVTRPVSNQASLDRVYYTEVFENTVQTDADLTQDYVSGPVLNLEGRVVGMTTSTLGVLIGEDIRTAVSSYLQNGKIQRPSMGLRYTNLSAPLARLRNLPSAGILVASTDEGSPARRAGILPGDLITRVNDSPVPANNFEKIFNQHTVGNMRVTLMRNNQEMNLTVTLTAK